MKFWFYFFPATTKYRTKNIYMTKNTQGKSTSDEKSQSIRWRLNYEEKCVDVGSRSRKLLNFSLFFVEDWKKWNVKNEVSMKQLYISIPLFQRNEERKKFSTFHFFLLLEKVFKYLNVKFRRIKVKVLLFFSLKKLLLLRWNSSFEDLRIWRNFYFQAWW